MKMFRIINEDGPRCLGVDCECFLIDVTEGYKVETNKEKEFKLIVDGIQVYAHSDYDLVKEVFDLLLEAQKDHMFFKHNETTIHINDLEEKAAQNIETEDEKNYKEVKKVWVEDTNDFHETLERQGEVGR